MLKKFGYLLSKNISTRFFLSLVYGITTKLSCLYLQKTQVCVALYLTRDPKSIIPGVSDLEGLLIVKSGGIENKKLHCKLKKLRLLNKLFPFLPFSSSSLTILEKSNLAAFKYIENFSDHWHPSANWKLLFSKQAIAPISRATTDELRCDYEIPNFISKSHISIKHFKDLRFLKKLETHLNQYFKVNIMEFFNLSKIEIINQSNKLLNQVLLPPQTSKQNIKIDHYDQKTFKEINIEIFNPLLDSFSIILIDTAIMAIGVKDFYKVFFVFPKKLKENDLIKLNNVLKLYPEIKRRSRVCSQTLFQSIIYNASFSEPLTTQSHSFHYIGLNLFPDKIPQNCELLNFNLKRYLYRQKYRFL
ncbi:MAG: hypothetical protein ACPGJV_10635, partial [Bacteriovoracaceae bacterium]